jgi:putative transposase
MSTGPSANYECQACGLVIDRDRNAALNLAALAAEYDTAGSGPVAARGADQKTRARGEGGSEA